MARRVVETAAVSKDRERLQVIVIYEEGIGKRDVKTDNPFTKSHGVLFMSNSHSYDYK